MDLKAYFKGSANGWVIFNSLWTFTNRFEAFSALIWLNVALLNALKPFDCNSYHEVIRVEFEFVGKSIFGDVNMGSLLSTKNLKIFKIWSCSISEVDLSFCQIYQQFCVKSIFFNLRKTDGQKFGPVRMITRSEVNSNLRVCLSSILSYWGHHSMY